MTFADAYRDSFAQLPPEELRGHFRDAWGRTQHRFVKVEAAPVFVEDGDESFEKFARGDVEGARVEVAARVLGQRDLFASLAARGATNVRIRIVGRPATPYVTEYERFAYAATRAIGEATFIVDESAIPTDWAAFATDFLLFDDTDLIVHEYTPWGRLVGISVTKDAEVIRLATELVAALEKMAVPEEQWSW